MDAALFATRPTLKPPEITSIGLPPEQHADRVVAAMMRHIAEQHANMNKALADVMLKGYFAASPRAQNRLADRFRKAGAIHVLMRTGKKGCYSVTFLELQGWDPHRDDYINEGDRIPEKPWIVCSLTQIINPGKMRPPDLSNRPMLYLTHHVLSRACQRHGLRTTEEVLLMSRLAAYQAAIWIHENGPEQIERIPATGIRINAGEETSAPITLVFKKHESRPALVATTVF